MPPYFTIAFLYIKFIIGEGILLNNDNLHEDEGTRITSAIF